MIEFLSDCEHLAALEVHNLDGLPVLGGTDFGAEQELEDRLLAESIWDDLEPPALLKEQTLPEIRPMDRAAVADRHVHMRDAGLEVVQEADDRAGQISLQIRDNAVAKSHMLANEIDRAIGDGEAPDHRLPGDEV